MMIVRPRRLRRTAAIRDMVKETRLSPSMLVYPVFVREGTNVEEDIPAMPGQVRYSPDTLPRVLERAAEAGLGAVLLFGIPDHKDETGSQAWAENGVIQRSLAEGKRHFPDLTLIADVCLCEYTSHGHCGVLKGETVDNDPTLELLARTAVSQARAGADVVAPSDMMDGRVGALRSALSAAGLEETLILSYAVKYASAFYGPFREAVGSSLQGDRRTYQQDPANRREGLREALLDLAEGADMVMVKPGLPYLDIVRRVKDTFKVPTFVYQVSGEYAMIKAAAQNGWIDERGVAMEALLAMKRAGANGILTYYALQAADWLKELEG